MPEQATIHTAKVAGIYRCTGLGHTKYCESGQSLPKHECDGGCMWELRKEDNMDPKDVIFVWIGRSRVFNTIETDELPEVGSRYNIRQAPGCGLQTGEHRVILVDDNFRWGGRSNIRIEIERVGGLSDELPIHQSVQINA